MIRPGSPTVSFRVSSQETAPQVSLTKATFQGAPFHLGSAAPFKKAGVWPGARDAPGPGRADPMP